MEKIKNISLLSLIVVLLVASSYQTYALMDINAQLNETGISFGKAKANYNFSSSTKALGELPDMAGGC